MAALSSKERDALPDSAFALEGRRYPIPDLGHARNALARAAGKPEEGQVKAAVHERYPALANLGKCEIEVPIWKDDSEQLVYGVVLTPGVADSQGDILSAEEIRKAAHSYLVASRKSDVQHAEVTLGFGGQPIAEVVESSIAPHDIELHGQKVLKGSWVMGMHVNDPGVWERVCKGELTGYSIGGSGIREPA